MTVAGLLDLARTKGTMIATAESCTGGLVAGALTDVPGSSDVFDRGVVTYSNAAKVALLGVDPELIDRCGAVSEDVARTMADGMLDRSDATLVVSVTGVAGPGGTAAKPEGMVCFGLAAKGHATRTETRQFGAIGRAKVRAASVERALELLADALS